MGLFDAFRSPRPEKETLEEAGSLGGEILPDATSSSTSELLSNHEVWWDLQTVIFASKSFLASSGTFGVERGGHVQLFRVERTEFISIPLCVISS